MALILHTPLPSGPAALVCRLPAASLALLARPVYPAYTGSPRIRTDSGLRRGRTFAGFAVATAADEPRVVRSPRLGEIAAVPDETPASVVEVVADERFACLERPEDYPGGGTHPVAR